MAARASGGMTACTGRHPAGGTDSLDSEGRKDMRKVGPA
jgi:hypothetical protein